MIRLLVAEDDDIVQRTILRTFRSVTSVEVHMTNNGFEALTRLRGEERYDFIVSDVNMPVMGGVEFFTCVANEFPSLLGRFVFFTSESPETVRNQIDKASPKNVQKLVRRMGLRVLDKSAFAQVRSLVAPAV
jgi:CheY-like chemotaxis protein